jgi:hypothetical protein
MPLPILFTLLMLLNQQPDATAWPIVVDRQPPTSDRTLFDPADPPPDMPTLHPGEAALCQFNFNCTVNLKYELVEQSAGNSSFNVSAHIRQVRVTLTLHNKIYIPRGGNAKIRAHEEGHRIINERVYEEAEQVARAAAMEVLTLTWRGSGDDRETAGKAATDEAVKHLCEAYLAGTAGKASRIGEIYDELTNHGRNTRLTEADAIRRAFAQYESEQRHLSTAD